MLLQELFFSGAIPSSSFPKLNASSGELEHRDVSGRGTLHTLWKHEPGFLVRNHRDPDEQPYSFAAGASASTFCFVPYGQAGGYGARFAAPAPHMRAAPVVILL